MVLFMLITETELRRTQDLMDFISSCPTAYQAADKISSILEDNKFTKLEKNDMTLESVKMNNQAFFTWNDSAVFAYRRGSKGIKAGMRIYVAHDDSPSLQIKPCPMSRQNSYYLAETLVYGGPILNTHFDRVLAIAGRAFVLNKETNEIEMKLVDLSDEYFYLPNVAIHFNRDVNSGHKIEAQTELRLVYASADDDDKKEISFNSLIAKKLSCDETAVLDYDLFTYNPGKGQFFGRDSEFFSISRIDDLAMVHAGLSAFVEKNDYDECFEGVSLLLIFSNEEIGSRTRQGAQSAILSSFIDLLMSAENIDDADRLNIYAKSFALSADQAHGLHPNYASYAANGTIPKLNYGPVLKYALTSYGTDAQAASYFKKLCLDADVPCQAFTNRSDLRGGSAIGPLLFPQVPIAVADIGNPQWSMHSFTESAGTKDQDLMIRVLSKFF